MYGTDKPFEKCTAFEEGQVFISNDVERPEGFCSWAWNDLYKDLSILNFGGNFWSEWTELGKIITCCSDGARPVSFMMERIEEKTP